MQTGKKKKRAKNPNLIFFEAVFEESAGDSRQRRQQGLLNECKSPPYISSPIHSPGDFCDGTEIPAWAHTALPHSSSSSSSHLRKQQSPSTGANPVFFKFIG